MSDVIKLGVSAEQIDKHYGLGTDKLFRDAFYGQKELTYIVSGDSTRDNSYNEMIDYYVRQFSQIGVTVVDNAESGQSAEDWMNNADANTIQQAIDATQGEGETTIMEYSFGLNDWPDDHNNNTEEDVFNFIKDSILMYLDAKPKATVIMAVPPITGNENRNVKLKDFYYQIGAELGLRVIDITIPTQSVFGDTRYYFDTTHCNKFGSRRIVNWIMQELIPADILLNVVVEEYPKNTPPPAMDELVTDSTLENGYYSTSTGLPTDNDDWLRLAMRVSIEPNFVLNIDHTGNRHDCEFYDENDEYIGYVAATQVSGTLYEVTIPQDAWYMRMNITSDASNYDTTQAISVKYKDTTGDLWLSTNDINRNMLMKGKPDLNDILSRLEALENAQ